VYASLLKSESLHGDLPVVIDRLLQLKTIHEEMAYIVSEFKTMDTEQAEIGGMLTSNEALLQKLESNFATNMEKVFENFKILEAKLSK
jgi:dynactin-2